MTNKKQLLDYAFEEAIGTINLNSITKEVAEEAIETAMMVTLPARVTNSQRKKYTLQSLQVLKLWQNQEKISPSRLGR